jgi:hypothetical protein
MATETESVQQRKPTHRPMKPITPQMIEQRQHNAPERLAVEKDCVEAIQEGLQTFQCSLVPAFNAVPGTYQQISVAVVIASVGDNLTEAERANDEKDCAAFIDQCFEHYKCEFAGVIIAAAETGTFAPELQILATW